MENAAAQNSPTSQKTTVGETVRTYVAMEIKNTKNAIILLSLLESIVPSASESCENRSNNKKRRFECIPKWLELQGIYAAAELIARAFRKEEQISSHNR